MTSKQPDTTEKVYQLKIHLVRASPMVWRRLLVHEDTSRTSGGISTESYAFEWFINPK